MNDVRLVAEKLIAEGKLKPLELAFKAGCSYTTVSSWLAGKRIRPSIERSISNILQKESPEQTLATG